MDKSCEDVVKKSWVEISELSPIGALLKKKKKLIIVRTTLELGIMIFLVIFGLILLRS